MGYNEQSENEWDNEYAFVASEIARIRELAKAIGESEGLESGSAEYSELLEIMEMAVIGELNDVDVDAACLLADLYLFGGSPLLGDADVE